MKSTKGVTSNQFLIKDLTGTSGRLDIIFRCLLATFSFGSRSVYFHTVLNGPPDPPKALEFNGDLLQNLPPDEIQLAHLFQHLLNPQHKSQLHGISLSNESFSDLCRRLSHTGPIFLLKENSQHFWHYLKGINNKKSTFKSFSFILGDSIDLEKHEEDFLLEELEAIPIDLGSQSYLASHCIIFVLMKLKDVGFLKDIE